MEIISFIGVEWMVNASLVADLLGKLEEEKDQWIYNAIERFDGQKVEKGQGLTEPENQIMLIKKIEHSIRQQKSLELEQLEIEMKTLEEGMPDKQRTIENLESTVDFLQKEVALYEGEMERLDKIQLEKFQCLLDERFEFDKKNQVVFKERRISKLMESYQQVEMEMLEFYQKQLSEIWLLLTRSMENTSSTAKFDFEINPPIMGLGLKHGRGLDHYIKLGNFEEDFRIVHDTLAGNNNSVYEYYFNQINQFQLNAKAEIMQLFNRKNEHRLLAEEKLLELREKKKQNDARFLELEDELGKARLEWEQDSLRPQVLEDILKEEFVKAVAWWQEKLFARDTSDEERWIYHQYCQIILKQAERIIGYEYF
jgi:hypothetical protein